MPKKSKSGGLKTPYIWAMARISLGLIFLWAFADKLWGLGFTTCRDAKTDAIAVMCEKAWLNGGSPTAGFLKFGTDGPFASFYQGLAGNTLVDWAFMLGLLLIGVALVAGIAMRLAAAGGVVMLMMMWSAVLPPEHHPFIDDHVVYSLVLLGLLGVNDNQKWGLKNWWAKQSIVNRFPILK